jgi:pectinesterase
MTRLTTLAVLVVVVTAIGAFAPFARAEIKADAVVAADGSGQYKTVQDAINAAPQTTSPANRWVILIKPGTYKERIYVQREKRFVELRGEDAEKAVITYDLNANLVGSDGKKIGTFRTPTAYVDADDFSVENITFENSAGPVGQALAIRVDGDRVAFRNCRFLGWQDTILINRGRHYFEKCFITGHVDFIFGGATAWFEQCPIECRGKGFVTAASTPDEQPFGFVFNRCEITGSQPDVKTFLGRPWRGYASTIYLNTKMSEVVQPEGWNNWGKPEREKTTRYAEFGSSGAGATPDQRVNWARKLSAREAEAITVDKVLSGSDGWNPMSSFAEGVAR